MAVYHKNEAWWIDYYYQGKRCRQKIGTRQKDAEEALNQVKVKIASGEFVPVEARQREESTGPQPVSFKTFNLCRKGVPSLVQSTALNQTLYPAGKYHPCPPNPLLLGTELA